MKKKVLLITVLCIVMVGVIGIAAFTNRSRGSDDINLIEPNPTKAPAEEAEPFPGISVLNDPEWVIRYKDKSSLLNLKSCQLENEYIDNLDGKIEFANWALNNEEKYHGLEDDSGNIYLEVPLAFGLPEDRSTKNTKPDRIAYVRLLTDEQAEQILNSDDIENLTPEEIYVLNNMLVLYDGRTIIEDQYINNIGSLPMLQNVYFTDKRAVKISNVWIPLEGKIGVSVSYAANLSYEIEILPEDSYLLNNGIKKNHIYRFSRGNAPGYDYIPSDWSEVCSEFPYEYLWGEEKEEYLKEHPDAMYVVPGT